MCGAIRRWASRMVWRPGPAKDGVSGALNEKTLRKGALWHNLFHDGAHLANDAYFPCLRLAAR